MERFSSQITSIFSIVFNVTVSKLTGSVLSYLAVKRVREKL